MQSTTGRFDGAAVPTNTVSKTDCASGGFMFYILPPICFALYIVGVSLATQHRGVLIAPAEQWKMIAAAVPSLCGCSAKNLHRSK